MTGPQYDLSRGEATEHKKLDSEQLTPKQEQFVENLAAGMSRAAAAKAAGYSAATADQNGRVMAKVPHIVKAVQRRREELKQKFRLKREDCVAGMLHAIKDAKLTQDSMAQIAGWREIAKMLGHYEPEKKVIEISDNREDALKQLEQLELDELLALAGPTAIEAEFSLVEEGADAEHSTH